MVDLPPSSSYPELVDGEEENDGGGAEEDDGKEGCDTCGVDCDPPEA